MKRFGAVALLARVLLFPGPARYQETYRAISGETR
jgi:hypothetical protein